MGSWGGFNIIYLDLLFNFYNFIIYLFYNFRAYPVLMFLLMGEVHFLKIWSSQRVGERGPGPGSGSQAMAYMGKGPHVQATTWALPHMAHIGYGSQWRIWARNGQGQHELLEGTCAMFFMVWELRFTSLGFPFRRDLLEDSSSRWILAALSVSYAMQVLESVPV